MLWHVSTVLEGERKVLQRRERGGADGVDVQVAACHGRDDVSCCRRLWSRGREGGDAREILLSFFFCGSFSFFVFLSPIVFLFCSIYREGRVLEATHSMRKVAGRPPCSCSKAAALGHAFLFFCFFFLSFSSPKKMVGWGPRGEREIREGKAGQKILLLLWKPEAGKMMTNSALKTTLFSTTLFF